MSVARWIQCEEAITEYGFLAKHPTTGNAIQSPYVAMSQNFMSQTNRLWMEILPNRQGELFQRVWRGHAPGRCDGAAAVRSERKTDMTKYKTAESVRRGRRQAVRPDRRQHSGRVPAARPLFPLRL